MSKNTDLVYNWAKDIYDILKEAESAFITAGLAGNVQAQRGIRAVATAKGYAQAVAMTVKPEEEGENNDDK